MSLREIKQVKKLTGKRVLVRVDFNVPLRGTKIVEDYKITQSLPTIEYLLKQGARVIIVSHLGRPRGVDPKLSLKPVAQRLAKLLGKPAPVVPLVGKAAWAKVIRKVEQLKNGELVVLENIRFLPDEEKNKGTLAKELSKLADLFVLDGFAVAHRAAASVSGVAKFIPAYAGFLLANEVTILSRAISHPKKPLVVILGGIKIETKIPILKNLLPKADHILVGGGISNTYLWAKGYKTGASLVGKAFKKDIVRYCSNKKVILPIDVVVGDNTGKKAFVMPIDKQFGITDKRMGMYSIGPETVKLFSGFIKKARTLIWNGALGWFEQPPYGFGNRAIAHLFAARSKGKAFGICGGGETVEVLKKEGLLGDIDLVSTGGGAMLEFLAGKKLPGITILQK